MYRCEKKISEFTTVSDEALAILIFENNLDTWKDMSEKNITKNSSVAKKYTNGGTSKGAVTSSRRYQGWSSNGLKRFNELFDLVKENCESNCANDFEESFLLFCINGGVNGKVKKERHHCLKLLMFVMICGHRKLIIFCYLSHPFAMI